MKSFVNGPMGNFLDIEAKQAHLSVDVNILGLKAMTRVVAGDMVDAGSSGGIVYMSSMAGLLGTGRFASYSASKAYQIAFAHALWYELKPRNIDVLACLAGPTRTPGYMSAVREDTRKKWIEQEPESVVSECLNAIGYEPSIATGVLNKISRTLFTRALPVSTAISVFGDETLSQVNFD
eukprot:g3246.t1